MGQGRRMRRYRMSRRERTNKKSDLHAAGPSSGVFPFREGILLFIYPENLKAKPMLWLWLLRDVAILGVCLILSFFALAQGIGMAPLVITALYAFLSIQVDGSSILDFLERAVCFLFLRQPSYEWGLNE